MKIAYLTDVEGNLEKLHSFFLGHSGFYQDEHKKWHVSPNAIFVYGGDICDRFSGDRAVVRELLRLKRESPENVILIAGNRDTNKIRLPLELSDRALAYPPFRKAQAYFDWLKSNSLNDCRVVRLKWILAKTMGAGEAFELRRIELARERSISLSEVDDEDVVKSYLDDLEENGDFFNLLCFSQLAWRIEGTLFVHSGLPAPAIGYVPGISNRIDKLDEWLFKLNSWYKATLEKWLHERKNWVGQGDPPGMDLIVYAEPSFPESHNPTSVIYGRTVDSQGKPKLPPTNVLDWLLKQGIHRLVLGHTPCGEIPAIERTEDGSFEMIVGDTSRSPRPQEAPIITFSGNKLTTTEVCSVVNIAGENLKIGYSIRIGERTLIGKRLSNDQLIVAIHNGMLIKYEMQPKYKVVYTLDLAAQE